MRKKYLIVKLSDIVFCFSEVSGNDVKVNIDQMRMCLEDLVDAESEIQLLNILRDMDKIDMTNSNMTYCVLEATGAGRRVEKIKRKNGNVGKLAAALVDKWKKNIRDENQRKTDEIELPAELKQSDVEINTTVTA